jgi:YegS/Rv2252/BmrU family lipid kinase
MEHIAVVAHSGKSLGGGLAELRSRLADAGVDDPLWFEVPKSKKARKVVHDALQRGADLVLVWGGDGMVQRCIDALRGSEATLAIIPAGTANLLASNLGIPHDLGDALDVALGGQDRRIDVGTVNGERFAVMSGVGFDARMIDGAPKSAKAKLGRFAYVAGGVSAMRAPADHVIVTVDGTPWYAGPATCVLVGNVGTTTGGLVVFNDARLDDGVLDLGVVTADGWVRWLRVLARAASHRAERSPFVQMTRAREIEVRLDRKSLYELDGGSRTKVRRLRYGIEPGALVVRVPR